MAWHGDRKRHSIAARKRVIRTVKRVLDGDTFEVARRIGNSRRIRITKYNAPEKNEPGGQSATNKLKKLIGGKKVSIIPCGRSYGRVVANVRVNRKLVSKAMKGRR